ncbi:MAG TPA: M1 family metallopeptidase, partial [Saprospiraceae bacterium]|nr:M1 family metallopeptidase [Saprospiraceae bacterium]
MKAYFLLAYFFFMAVQAFAQPVDDFIPCHHALQHQLHRSKPTQEELQMMENSNRRSDSIDVLNYAIDIDVTNYTGKSIIANTTVRFKTKIDQLEWISLDLKSLTVDSILFRGFQIPFSYDGDLILARFGQPLALGTEDEVRVYYRGVPTRDPVWGGFYFVDDYIYNLGIGLSTTPPNFGKVWFPCFDNFVERSTYDYYVTTTMDKKAYCVGTFISEDSLPNKRIRRHYSMKMPITTYLSSIAAANYAVYKSEHSGAFRDIPIELIAKPADLAQMVTQFAKIGTAIDAFEYWFGPYRFERVGFVATTQGAMEHPTNVAYPVTTIQNGTLSQNERLFAHEYGHHWWGDLTTLDDARDMWIKEGTAEYSSHLFVERAYGREAFVNAVKSNLSYILFLAHENDGAFLPLSPMPYDQTYGTHTYRKGAAMIHNMRGYMGDDRYRRVCTMVFDSLTGKSMNAYEFRDFLNRNSGVDMTAYFDDYIFNPGYCAFYIDTFQAFTMNGQHFADIQIRQKSYHAAHLYRDVPLTISMYDKNMLRLVVKQRVSGDSHRFTVLLPDNYQPEFAIVNEDQELNFASLQSQTVTKKTGTADLPYTAMAANVSQITDSAYIHIAHHLVGPDVNGKADNIDKISTKHFWQVSMIAHGDLKLDGRVEYNGVDTSSLDSDILYKSEDSLILVYRKDWTEPWR